MWLWHCRTGLTRTEVDLAWQAFPRRFDIEHTFRMLKQTLGSDHAETPLTRRGRPLDLVLITAYTQLRLARELVGDPRRPRGETPPGPPAEPVADPPRVSEPVSTTGPSRPCPETLTTRTRTPRRTTQPSARDTS
nr:hypothetical protein GCM10020241_38290 [Streptoalloteichus tenebrarius]